MKSQIGLLALVVLSSFLLFYRLGATSLANWDEAMFAAVSQDMVKRGDLLDGRMNGQLWVYEPPLVTWILAVILKTFGSREFWLRSYNAVFGFVIGMIVYKIAVSISGKKIAGFLSALVLFSDIEFLFRARQINVEIPLTMFLLISLGSLVLLRKREAHHALFLPIGALALGLAFLTKRATPLLAIPALSFLMYSDWKRVKRTICISSFLFFLVSVPWFFASYLKWGDKFIHEFFVDYTVGKIRSVNIGTGTSFLFYFSALRHALKSWVLLLPFILFWSIGKVKKDPIFLGLGMYVITFMLALTVVPIKSSWFLLPIHPVLAILIGVWLCSCLSLYRKKKLYYVLITGGVVAVSVFQLWKYRNDFIVPDTTGRQVAIVKQAALLLKSDESLYLDDDYLPVAVFYGGNRKVIPLRFDRLGRPGGLPIIPPAGSLILTNDETIEKLRENMPAPLVPVAWVADLWLLRVQSY